MQDCDTKLIWSIMNLHCIVATKLGLVLAVIASQVLWLICYNDCRLMVQYFGFTCIGCRFGIGWPHFISNGHLNSFIIIVQMDKVNALVGILFIGHKHMVMS